MNQEYYNALATVRLDRAKELVVESMEMEHLQMKTIR